MELVVLEERKKHGQTHRRWIYTTIWEKQFCVNIVLLNHALHVLAFWILKKMFKVSIQVSMQALQETDFWNPTVFHHIWLGLFTMITYETSFQNCCKMCICGLGHIYGSCMIVLQHIFFLQFGNSWTTCFWNMDGKRWTTARSACFPDFSCLDFYIWGHLKATVYATVVTDIQGLTAMK
jgi:hypothetical protein